jgi:class 3 adenylate cyclase
MSAIRDLAHAEDVTVPASPLCHRLIPRLALRDLGDGDAVPAKAMRLVAALFVDVEGCARLCEDLSPHRMNEVIETYFAAYLDAARAAGGEVTEVLGDGLVALFEARTLQQAARGALDAALAIKARTQDLNARRRRWHDPIVVNVGLEAGRALTGLTRLRGSSGERWVYAASGPVTNVAARLCALARHGQILTTQQTAALLPRWSRCRSLGPRRLKNVAQPVDVVQIRPPDRHDGLHRAAPTGRAKGGRTLTGERG